MRAGNPVEALPSWLLGKRFLDFRGEPYPDASYESLVAHLIGIVPQPPPVRSSVALAASQLSPTSLARQDSYADFINAAIKVFQATNKRLVLHSRNNAASRLLLPEVEREIEEQGARVDELLQTFLHQSSEEVQKAAGGVVASVLAAKITSMHPKLTEKNKEAFQQFLKESLPKFRDATRSEGGLR